MHIEHPADLTDLSETSAFGENREGNGDDGADKRITARRKLVEALTREILAGAYQNNPLMPSEHQLCRRFSVSRVTVRLALSDLESRGLIYRHHGKGTFAHPLGKVARKAIGIVLRRPEDGACPFARNFAAGVQAGAQEAESDFIILHRPSLEWEAGLATRLGGVVAMPDAVGEEELQNIRQRGLACLLLGGSEVPRLHRLDAGLMGVAREIMVRFCSKPGRRVVVMRRDGRSGPCEHEIHEGIDEALRECGRPPESIITVKCPLDPEGRIDTLRRFCREMREPAAVFCVEAVQATSLYVAARETGRSIPADIAVACAEDTEAASALQPPMATARADYFELGRRAASALISQAISGSELSDISVPATLHWRASGD